MAKAPTVRATSVRATSTAGLFKAFLTMILFIAITASIVGELISGTAIGLFAFVFYRLVIVREIICRQHRKGVLLTKEGDLEKALQLFLASEHTWKDRRWMDNARGFLLASAGPWSYLSLARYNQAYCLAHLGRGAQALEKLDAIVRDHPDMALARQHRDALKASLLQPPATPDTADSDPTWGGMIGGAPDDTDKEGGTAT